MTQQLGGPDRLKRNEEDDNFVWDTGSMSWVKMVQPFVSGPITATITNDGTFATPGKQDTGNASLASIKTNTDPLVASGAGGYIRQDSTATIAKETGGNLADIKTNTDPLVASGAGGYIRQDSTFTIARETGGNLASVKTNTDPFVSSTAGGYIRFQRPTTAQLSRAVINISTSGDNIIVAGVAAQTIRVWQMFGVATSSVVVTIKDASGGTALTGPMTLGSITLDQSGEPWFVSAVAGAFVINLGAAIQFSGEVWYTQS